jgi:hypothetical protein
MRGINGHPGSRNSQKSARKIPAKKIWRQGPCLLLLFAFASRRGIYLNLNVIAYFLPIWQMEVNKFLFRLFHLVQKRRARSLSRFVEIFVRASFRRAESGTIA